MAGIKMGIDLGTSAVRICVDGKGVVLREAAVLAIDEKTGEILASGNEAKQMIGREPPSIRVIRPMRGGVIADYEYAEKMIRLFVGKVCAYRVFKPRAAVSIPSAVTEVEQRSVVQAMTTVGIRRVALIEEYVASAVGAGLDVTQAHGCMSVNIGAGTTDAAVLSLRGVSAAVSARVGGDDLDEAIIRTLRTDYAHVIGPLTAEEVKKTIGSALPSDRTMTVRGRDAVTGLPCVKEVSAAVVRRAIEEPLQDIVAAVCSVLENTPPEIVGDVMSDGIVLTGGGSLLHGMAEYLTEQTGVTCRVAPNPEDCVALGAGDALRYLRDITGGVYDINQFAYDRTDWGG